MGYPGLPGLILFIPLKTGEGVPNPQERELAYTDLRDWIKTLEKAGELKRITVEVDPNLEMAEIADRTAKLGRGTAKAGGPALLFENVKGHLGAKVLMNQFGSDRRMKMALEVDSLDEVAGRIRALLDVKCAMCSSIAPRNCVCP